MLEVLGQAVKMDLKESKVSGAAAHLRLQAKLAAVRQINSRAAATALSRGASPRCYTQVGLKGPKHTSPGQAQRRPG